MTRRVAYVFAGLLGLVGGAVASLAAAPRPAPEPSGLAAVDAAALPDAEVLVGALPLPRYAHGSRLYIEALRGQDYAIRLRNPFPVRVAVALSVDGLNTIDARDTTARDALKWVIEPYGTVTIRGWQTSQSEARHFEFTTEARSYGQALGKTANLGVITAVFFKERPNAIVAHPELNRFDRRQAQRSRDHADGAAAPAPADAERSAGGVGTDAPAAAAAPDEFAATGMGRRTDHVVTRIAMDLEDAPVHAVSIRYEFRPQLVRLGVLPRERRVDPLTRREGARGFAPEFSPVPGPR